MFSRIVSFHDHLQSTGNDSSSLLLFSPTHPQRYVNKMDYYVGFTYSSSALVARNFAKNKENFKGGLCLNVITPFTIIVVVLQLRDVPKTVI